MPPLQFSSQGACKIHQRTAVSAAIFAKIGRYARFWFGLRRVRTTKHGAQGDTESCDQGAASGKTRARDLQELSRAGPPQLRPCHGDRFHRRSRKEAALCRLELHLGRPARLARPLQPDDAVLFGLCMLVFAFAIARFDGRVYPLLFLLLLVSALNILVRREGVGF